MELSAFDYIAMPKGQMPGGPVQNSAGHWYVCVQTSVSFAWQVEQVLNGAQMSGRADDGEIREAIELLQKRLGQK